MGAYFASYKQSDTDSGISLYHLPCSVTCINMQLLFEEYSKKWECSAYALECSS